MRPYHLSWVKLVHFLWNISYVSSLNPVIPDPLQFWFLMHWLNASRCAFISYLKFLVSFLWTAIDVGYVIMCKYTYAIWWPLIYFFPQHTVKQIYCLCSLAISVFNGLFRFPILCYIYICKFSQCLICYCSFFRIKPCWDPLITYITFWHVTSTFNVPLQASLSYREHLSILSAV